MEDVGIIERAFQLASECGSLNEVRQRLAREGYSCVEAHLAGRQIKSDIHRRLNPELRAESSPRR